MYYLVSDSVMSPSSRYRRIADALPLALQLLLQHPAASSNIVRRAFCRHERPRPALQQR